MRSIHDWLVCCRPGRLPGFVLGFTQCLNEETEPAAVLFLRMPTCLDPDSAPTRRARGRIACFDDAPFVIDELQSRER
jgi:hypothetical protein